MKKAKAVNDHHFLHYQLPHGDGDRHRVSPYVPGKHLQLVDKDPDAEIVFFWKDINEGDRVDSALKDMAVVLKQQDRAEEAIEAIRSFRDRCSVQGQESLDNGVIDLYKVNQGRAYMQLGKHSAAEVVYRKAQLINPDSNKASNLACCLISLADPFIEGIDHLMRAWTPARSKRLPVFD